MNNDITLLGVMVAIASVCMMTQCNDCKELGRGGTAKVQTLSEVNKKYDAWISQIGEGDERKVVIAKLGEPFSTQQTDEGLSEDSFLMSKELNPISGTGLASIGAHVVYRDGRVVRITTIHQGAVAPLRE